MSTGTKDWAAAGTSSRGDGAMVAQPPPPNYHAASAAGPAVLPMIGTAPDCRFCKWHMYGHLGDPAQACGGHEEEGTQ